MTISASHNPFRLVQKHTNAAAGYILSTLPSPSGLHLLTPTTSGLLSLYDLATLSPIQQLQALPNGINAAVTEARFDKSSEGVVWVADNAGGCRAWDTRNGSGVVEVHVGAPVLSLDINTEGRVLVAGTELVGEDAKISIWDIRNTATPAAEFIECHSDDITQLRFHPSKPSVLLSGSTDGLLCLFDLTTLEEDDAIYQIIKSDSVSKLGFFGPEGEYIYALSHMETFALWKVLDADKVCEFGDVRRDGVDYLVDCVWDGGDGRMYLVGGDNRYG
ncbi:WD40-repeat-containing domain protein [Phlyctochytrium arcticum]|nr:WD40-repeat-containing domain protein [Phlyctochytrium arcticum]